MQQSEDENNKLAKQQFTKIVAAIQILLASRKFDEAIEMVNQRIAENQTFHSLFALKSQILNQQGKFNEAADCLKTLIDTEGDKVEQSIQINYAITLSKIQQSPFQQVVDQFWKGIKMNETSPQAALGLGQLGNFYFNKQKFQESLDLYDKVLTFADLNPNLKQGVLKNKAICQNNLGQSQNAEITIQNIIQYQNPLATKQAQEMLVTVKYNRMINNIDQPEISLALSQQIIETLKDKTDPRLIEALFVKGLCKKHLNQDGVIEAYAELLKIEPNHIKALNNLANEYLTQNQIEKAKELYLKCLKHQPNFVVYNSLGMIYFMVEPTNYRKALDYLNKALELQPQNLIVLANRAYLNFEMQNFNDSAEDIQQLKELIKDPKNLATLKQNQIHYIKQISFNLANFSQQIQQGSINNFFELSL